MTEQELMPPAKFYKDDRYLYTVENIHAYKGMTADGVPLTKDQEYLCFILSSRDIWEGFKKDCDRSFKVTIEYKGRNIVLTIAEHDTGNQIMTVGDVAAFLNVSREQVYSMTRTRTLGNKRPTIPVRRLGKKGLRFDRVDVAAWRGIPLTPSPSNRTNGTLNPLTPELKALSHVLRSSESIWEGFRATFDRSLKIVVDEEDGKIVLKVAERDAEHPIMTYGDVATLLQLTRDQVRTMTRTRTQKSSELPPIPFHRRGLRGVDFDRGEVMDWWASLGEVEKEPRPKRKKRKRTK